MEGDFHQKGKIYQKGVFSWCTQGKLKLLDAIVIMSHSTRTNQITSSVAVGCLSPSC